MAARAGYPRRQFPAPHQAELGPRLERRWRQRRGGANLGYAERADECGWQSGVRGLDDITREIGALCDATEGGVRAAAAATATRIQPGRTSRRLMAPQPDGTRRAAARPSISASSTRSATPSSRGRQAGTSRIARDRPGGKLPSADQSRVPLATGEFLLGHLRMTSQDIRVLRRCRWDFSRNGTFVAYRKLHQEMWRRGTRRWSKLAQQFAGS